MVDDNSKVWSCVGSAGAVNPADIGKVVCVGSIAQLGPSSVITRSPEAAARRAGPVMQAVIRYGVTAVDGAFNPNLNDLHLSLAVLCRPGSGQSAARLVQVYNPALVTSVVETTLVEFQVQPKYPNLFGWRYAYGGHELLDFEMYVYYVEVVLSAGDVVSEYPPAVAAIQLTYRNPPGGGPGGGGRGTGNEQD